MGFGSHNVPGGDNTTYLNTYHPCDVNPPVDARRLQSCGCYVVVERDDSDRCWVTYTTETTHHYLCVEHMAKHNDAVNMQRKEKEERKKLWEKRCRKCQPAADLEIKWLIGIVKELRLDKLMEIKKVPEIIKSNWDVKIYKREVSLLFQHLKHSQFCPKDDSAFLSHPEIRM